ncbi:phosphatidylethanolamine-binding protein, partial [Bipolaris maydis]
RQKVTAKAPSLSAPQLSPASNSSLYILLMIDIDVPRNNTRVPLIHWLAPNISLSSSPSASLVIPSPNPVPYLQPSPPVGDIPHAYNFVLFEQPAGFQVPARYAGLAGNRVGFDVRAFVADAGLAGVVASGWLRVQNLTGVATPTGTGSGATPSQTGYTGPESNGGGRAAVVAAGWMGVFGALAVVAGMV